MDRCSGFTLTAVRQPADQLPRNADREHPLQSEYPYSGVLDRFYVYVDTLSSTAATNLDDTNVMSNFTSGVLPSFGKKGWFMDLDQYGQGEQTVTSAVIAAGMVAFSTNRPVPASAGSCSTQLGAAQGYWVNVGGQMETVVIGASQLTGGVSSAISTQQVKPSIVPVRKEIFWKSSGEN